MTQADLDLLMQDALKATVKKLLVPSNQVTTKEVKAELRKEFPTIYWEQAYISAEMAEMAIDGVLIYEDNGIYRTYSYPPVLTANEILSKKDKKRLKKLLKKEELKTLLNGLITPYNIGSQNASIHKIAELLKIEL